MPQNWYEDIKFSMFGKGKKRSVKVKSSISPVCDICGKPVEGKGIASGKKSYHPECFRDNVAYTCSLCAKPIMGAYVKDYWQNIYHAAHQQKALQCMYCGRFLGRNLTNGGTRYSDGRIICGLCLKQAVSNIQEADRIVPEIISNLADNGIDVRKAKYKLYLIGRAKLKKLSSSKEPEESGYTSFKGKFENGSLKRMDISIFILKGLPKYHFIHTAAHELMHVWLYMNAPQKAVPALKEGSCNFAGYRVLSHYTSEDARYVEHTLFENKDKVYGKGFRDVYNFAQKRGVSALLHYLRNNKRLP